MFCVINIPIQCGFILFTSNHYCIMHHRSAQATTTVHESSNKHPFNQFLVFYLTAEPLKIGALEKRYRRFYLSWSLRAWSAHHSETTKTKGYIRLHIKVSSTPCPAVAGFAVKACEAAVTGREVEPNPNRISSLLVMVFC